MKPFQTAYAIAAVAAAMFFYQVNQLSHWNEEAAVFLSQYDQHTSVSANAGSFVRAFVDGATLGAFADEGIFSESKKYEREDKQLAAQRASLISRHDTATFYRNTGLIVAIIAGIVGFTLKKQSRNVA